jgi:hypothetical protein
VTQPINRNLLDFDVQIKKPSRWFWCINYQIVVADFEIQTGKPSTTGFEGKPEETVITDFDIKSKNHHHQFWGQAERNRSSSFEGKLPINRSSYFEAKPLTNHSSDFEVKPLTNCWIWFLG